MDCFGWKTLTLKITRKKTFENDDESPTVLTYNIIKFSDVCSSDVCSIFFPNTYFRVLEAIQVSRIPEKKIPKMSQKVSSKRLW